MNQETFERFVTTLWANESLNARSKHFLLLGAGAYAGQLGHRNTTDLFWLASIQLHMIGL